MQRDADHAQVLGWLQLVHDGDILTPTLHGENGWRPPTACIAGVNSCICSLQVIDNKLDSTSISPEAILAAGRQDLVTVSPDHAGSGLCGLTAKTSALSCLSLKFLQVCFEKNRLGCMKGNQGNYVSNTKLPKPRKKLRAICGRYANTYTTT